MAPEPIKKPMTNRDVCMFIFAIFTCASLLNVYISIYILRDRSIDIILQPCINQTAWVEFHGDFRVVSGDLKPLERHPFNGYACSHEELCKITRGQAQKMSSLEISNYAHVAAIASVMQNVSLPSLYVLIDTDTYISSDGLLYVTGSSITFLANIAYIELHSSISADRYAARLFLEKWREFELRSSRMFGFVKFPGCFLDFSRVKYILDMYE